MSAKEKGAAAGIVAAMISAGVFLAFWLLIGVPLPFSLGAAVLGYAGSFFMIKGIGDKLNEERPLDLAFVDKELADRVVAEGKASAQALREQIALFPKGHELARRFTKVADLIAAIAADVEADPKDASAAQGFLSIQGQTAARLARLALDLEKRGASEGQLTEAYPKLVKTLERLQAACERHLARLQEDNLAELQAELEVLEQSLGFETEFEELEARPDTPRIQDKRPPKT